MLKFCVHDVILKVPEPAPGRTSGQDLVSKTVARAKTDYCCFSYLFLQNYESTSSSIHVRVSSPQMNIDVETECTG